MLPALGAFLARGVFISTTHLGGSDEADMLANGHGKWREEDAELVWYCCLT